MADRQFLRLNDDWVLTFDTRVVDHEPGGCGGQHRSTKGTA